MPARSGQALIAIPARAKRMPARAARTIAATGGEALGAVTQRQSRREQRQPSSKPRIGPTAKSECLSPKCGTVLISSASRGRPGAAPALPPLDRVTEDRCVRHHGEGDRTAGEHRLHDGDCAIERAATWRSQAAAARPQPMANQRDAARSTGTAKRLPDLDGRDTLSAPVLEE